MHRIIYEELCLGIITEGSRQAYRDVISRLVAAGAEGIILGCTEIELLIGSRRQSGTDLPNHPTPRRGGRRSLLESVSLAPATRRSIPSMTRAAGPAMIVGSASEL